VSSPVPAPALELRDVHAGYGRIEVLHGVDLVIPAGSVYALLGPNGGGKSTTLKVISGRLTPSRGCVHVAGSHVNGAATARLARAGICSVPEGRGIFPNLTVEENLLLATYVAPELDASTIKAAAFARFPALRDRSTQIAGTLSGGEQQMLAMARALTTEPAVLLLDELSMGLAPLVVRDLYESVAELREEGMSILLVEQFARIALPIADYVGIMLQGEIRYSGEPGDIEGDLDEAYLGGSAA
jgi:branched-chain amino acid transport system ATP-binding protein